MRPLITYAAAALALATIAAACGGGSTSETSPGAPTPFVAGPSTGSGSALSNPTPSPKTTTVLDPTAASPTATAVRAAPPAATAAAPAERPPSEEYDSNEAMFGIYGGPQQTAETTLLALRSIVDANDTSQVPVIVELSRFLTDPVLGALFNEALELLTGEDFGIGRPGGWLAATEWLGERRGEYPPPSHYLAWKINLLSAISDRYQIFLGDADRTARIDVTELLWGGVRPDGIPDLQHAPTVKAGEADYLGPDERVFGVSINGEHRAYPLRIMNPHEMANDTLGGEPIALAY